MNRFVFIAIFLSSLVVSHAQNNTVVLRQSGSAVIDGKIDEKEWEGARVLELTNGGKLFLKYDGSFVYLAMRGSSAGWSHLYLNDGTSDVSVIHASAALGRVIYKQNANKIWQPANEFIYEVRERVITDAMRAAMSAYLAKNGWVASNNNMGNASEVEYKFAATPNKPLRFAAVFMSDATKPQHFPATLTDDTLRQKLLEGNAVPDIKFDVTQWARLEVQPPTSEKNGYWEGAVTRDGKQWRVGLNLTNDAATVDFVDLDVIDVAFPLKVDGNRVRLEKPQPSGNPIIFDGDINGDAFAGNWTGFGVEGTFSLKRGVRKVKAFREEEIAFQNGDVKLSGTLFLPNGSGKFPTVIITHGSVPHERSGYRSWARRFANNGIAALIYDKRGAGKSTGNTRAASMEELADDALAGLCYLKTRTEVNTAKIGVIGHSQGGYVAPLAGIRSKDVAFVIASAAAGIRPAEQSIYHRAGVMRSAGMTETEIEQATKLRESLYELNRKILKGDRTYQQERAAVSRELIANSGARWFGLSELPPDLVGEVPPIGALRLLFFDIETVWEKLKLPVLVVYGSEDSYLPVEKSRDIITRAQSKARNKNLTMKIFPNVDHGNNVVRKDGEWDFPRVNLDIDQTMVEWVNSLFGHA